MTASNTQAVATAIVTALIGGVVHLAQDPTVRAVAQDPDVIAAWRNAYGPVKRAICVTSDTLKKIGEVDRLAAA